MAPRSAVVTTLWLGLCVQMLSCANEATTDPSTAGGQSTVPDIGVSNGENKFLRYLFNKYGSKGVISFEGLEHLMFSLGLGGLNFQASHTLEEHRPEGFELNEGDLYKESDAAPVTVAINEIEGYQRPSSKGPSEAHAYNTVAPMAGDHHHHQAHNHTAGNRTNPDSSDRPESGARNDRERLASDKQRSGGVGTQWQEIIFKDLHDPRHRHPRNQNGPSCLSPMSIIHLILEEPLLAKHQSQRKRRALPHHHHHQHQQERELDDDDELLDPAGLNITPSEFKDLCPAFLVQLDQRACLQNYQKANDPRREKKSFSQAWIYGIVSITIISLCGLVGVAMVPLAKSVAYDDILRFLIAIGVGTLCGDAFMHLLPHALLPHDHDDGEHSAESGGDHHDHHSSADRAVWICLCTFASAFLMYTLEMVLPLFRDGEGHGHSHAHSSGRPHQSSNRVEPSHVVPVGGVNTNGNTSVASVMDEIELEHQTAVSTGAKEASSMLKKKSPSKPLSAIAFMVILGDGLHNLTDGLAIGAAFAVEPVTGMATAFAILCHELPHELGDFALLLQTGVSIRRALFLNIVSSILSFIGMFLGLFLTGLHKSMVSWIYAGTAGTFLYIALSDLVPEMRNDLTNSTQKLKVIVTQLSGIVLGAIIMLLIALNEDELQTLFE